MWVGKTLFYFQALPKIAFDNTVEMIAIEPDGKQRKHAYLPRAFNNTFPAAEDCPRADPKDLKRSILWAKQFSNTIECSLQDMNAKCEFECDEEGFVCEHCERLIRPACAGLVPGLEFLADTGSEEDLISKSDCRAHFPDVPIGPFTRPVSLTTANGPVKGDQSVKLEVPEISSILECYVLEGISQRPSEPQQQGTQGVIRTTWFSTRSGLRSKRKWTLGRWTTVLQSFRRSLQFLLSQSSKDP